MIRGIYTAATGMIAETIRTDTIANNLANVNTSGYKKDITVNKDFSTMLIHRINDGKGAPAIGHLGIGTAVDEIATSHAPGPVRPTGNKLDVAIAGKGFFVIATPNGERYTRDGSFTRNVQGELVTQDGYRVSGANGPILIPDIANRIDIAPDGRVLADDVEVGSLNIVQFQNEKQLLKQGANLYIANGADPQTVTGQIEQGYLEQSNVNVVAEMVNLIAAYRAYEVSSKTVQAQDQMLDKAVNEVGRV